MNRAEKRRQQKITKKKQQANSPQDLTVLIQQAFIIAAQQQNLGNLSEATKLFQQILQLDPNHADTLLHLGVIAGMEGKPSIAIELISKSLVSKPRSADSHFNLGNAFNSQGNTKNAELCYRKAIELNPTFVDAYNNLGMVLKDLGSLDQATEAYLKAINLNPEYAGAHNNLAMIYKEKGKLEEAISSFHKAIFLAPNLVEAHSNLGACFQVLDNTEEALICYRKAIELKPDHISALNNLGLVLNLQGKPEEALPYFHQILSLSPDNSEAHGNLGAIFKELGNLDKAEALYRKAITLEPNNVQFHYNLSFILLLQGNLEQGWKEYDWGLKKDKDPRARIFDISRWQGEPLEGKNILIYAEQGIGDEIMFAGCIPDLIARSPNKIFLDCEPRLEALFARSFPSVDVSGRRQDDKVYWLEEDFSIDYCLPIGSLPKFFRNNTNEFPDRKSFLLPDQVLTKSWAHRLSDLGDGLKVGISWRGGNKGNINKKSIPLDKWKNLLSLNACFINLQYGDTIEEIDQMRQNYGIEIFDWEDNDPMKDLDNQAALISALDLVITVNNTTYGSSSALGVPTWNMLDSMASYMMMTNFEDTSPYFPSLRLFRKQSYGGWEQVLNKVEACLQDQMKEH